MWFGVGLGFIGIVANFLYFQIPPNILILIGFLHSPFPFLQIKFQQRWFKILARTALGIGGTLVLVPTIILIPLSISGLISRILIIGVFAMLAQIALNKRSQNKDDPCDDCPEGAFPLCGWNLPDLTSILQGNEIDEESREFLEIVVESLSNGSKSRMKIYTAEEFLSKEN
jgi:hypothetical protein